MKPNGNCSHPSDDGWPVQCVGPWSRQKHDYLRRYIEASSGPRSKFVRPRGDGAPLGGAAFIDLFAGPGRARIRDTGEFIPGSPILAHEHSKAPFTRLIFCELDPENVDALSERTHGDPRVEIIAGDCNNEIARVADLVPTHGLNLALVDPYGMRAISFETIRMLASFKRMDLLIHFPTGDMKRNFEQDRGWFERFVGTDDWGFELLGPSDIARLIPVLKAQLGTLGYSTENVRSMPITNNQNVTLYHLVYVSKDRAGDRIWKSITSISASGQRGFTFG